jgi:hypothetical protein
LFLASAADDIYSHDGIISFATFNWEERRVFKVEECTILRALLQSELL